ncbi:MAG: phosphoenolpyruvate mutase [Gammaproteobacteria bacterium]|nr:phosphoenolpyruvate mutase [Gammaproteobacteria bacterium]MBI5615356.1 phosphoenolpyruvate mutase [Gammaproteobacteria bacterium]
MSERAAARLRKTTQLKNLLRSAQLEFILEAHNGISARIAEEAGFKGIWASGLAISAQFGVRDNNEASWTQVVDMLEFMSDATSIPILLDGDTGYGNFNNMRRLVRKLEQRGIGGVCIEDKIFPKTNSFIDGERQPLADVAEFCGKIAAGKDSQADDDFCVVARVEALIAGWDVPEALRRAEAYRRAGADGILIHSKLSRPDQILEFAAEWGNRAPLVIVPTKYYSTPVEVFRKAKISLVIWANHLIRSAVSAMQNVAEQIQRDEGLIDVEDRIASVDEIFRLQGADELAAAQERYSSGRRDITAIVLGASRGDDLASLTSDRPKLMLPVGGKPLLRHLVDKFKKRGIDQIMVVAGYKAETIDVSGVEVLVNDRYAATGELVSLARALDRFTDDMVVLYGDLLFRSYILRDLMENDAEITVVVDSSSQTRPTASGSDDFAFCSEPDDRSTWGQAVTLTRITRSAHCGDKQADGRWIGMMRVRGAGRRWLEEAMAALGAQADFDRLGMPDLLNFLVASGRTVRVWYIHGHWLDVNSVQDLECAGNFAAGQS